MKTLFCVQVKLAWWSISAHYKASKDCLTLEQATATLKGFWSVWNYMKYTLLSGAVILSHPCKPWCHIVTQTPKGLSVQTIQTDPEFWEPVRSQII